MKDLLRASHDRNAGWVYSLLHDETTLMVTPKNYTITGRHNITLFLTAYNLDLSLDGRYVIPKYEVALQIQNDGVVATQASVVIPSFSFEGTNHTVPFVWWGFFDEYHRLQELRIHIDTFTYPALQAIPDLSSGYTLLSFSAPPPRPYDGCIGRRTRCPSYEEP